jgi:hypothetical protein
MDFIEERPLSTYPGGPVALARAVGDMLGRVQTTPPCSRVVDYPDIVGRLWAWVCQTGLFAPGVLDLPTERLERICAAYVWNVAEYVSSHNDPAPRNLLFDGEFDGERLWLIDWKSAYRSDPLVDVAITLDNFAPSPALESVLLSAGLGRAPDDALYARLALVQALRLYYSGVLLSASAAALGAIEDRYVAAPSLPEFRHAASEGRLKPDTAETKHFG